MSGLTYSSELRQDHVVTLLRDQSRVGEPYTEVESVKTPHISKVEKQTTIPLPSRESDRRKKKVLLLLIILSDSDKNFKTRLCNKKTRILNT